ncbi:MAG: hypothetical protein ACTSYI_03820 [Promethearchaeota archaeon]
MKIGALIGSFFVLIGSFLRFSMFSLVDSTSVWTTFRYQASFEGFGIFPILANVFFLLGVILVLVSGFVKTTVMMIIGTIFYLLATLVELGFWLSNQMYGVPLVIINGVYIIASLLYLLGLISFRKRNKITIITGIILFLATLGIQGAMGIFSMINFINNDSFIQLYFQLLYIESFLWTVHAFLFSLSKKDVGWKHEDDEDELSIESGAAFASYVPAEKKTKKKKRSKKDDEFTFDF